MKRILCAMLAVLLLAVPALSLAASPVEMLEQAVEAGRPLHAEVSMQAGEMPMGEADAKLVSDIINALGFRMDVQQGDAPQTSMALKLSGKEVLTFAVAEKGGDTFLKTNLAGADVMAFNAQEAQNTLNRLMQMMADSGLMTREQLDEVMAQFASMAGMGSMTSSAEGLEFDTAALLSLTADLAEAMTMEGVTSQPRGCDEAKTRMSFTMTRDMLLKWVDLCLDMVRKNESYMAALNQQLTGMAAAGSETVTDEELLEQLRQQLNDSITAFGAPVSILLDEKDEPVYILMDAAMTIAEDDEQEDLDVTFTYTRLTGTEGVNHSATLIANDEEKDGMSMTFGLLEGEKRAVVSFDLAEMDEGVTEAPILSLTAELLKEREETSARDQLNVTMTLTDSGKSQSVTLTADASAEQNGEDVAFQVCGKLYLPGCTAETITVNAQLTTGEAETSIVTEDAVRPGAMADDEFNAFLGQVAQSAQTALLVMLQNLPDSVLQLFRQ